MKKIAIIGAGISGLFIANLFKKNSNYQITIYEKNNSINLEEGYGIQLSVNSVKLLNQIELGWKTHLQNADILRETIGWRAYGQLDPLREYKTEGFNLFVETIREIKYNSVYDILKSQFP